MLPFCFFFDHVGSPYAGGAGFPAGIAKAANAYFNDIGSNRHAYDLTGNSFDVIASLVERDAEQFIEILEQCGSMALYVR